MSHEGPQLTDAERELLVATFVQEAHELFETMEEALIAVEQRPQDAEQLHEIFRAVHTLKGNASMVRFVGIAALAHVMEDALDRMLDGRLSVSAELVSLLLAVVDALRELVRAAALGRDESSPLIGELERFVAAHEGSSKESGEDGEAPRALRATAGADDSKNRGHRISAERLDRILDMMGELTIARSRVGSLVDEKGDADLRDAHQSAERLAIDLQAELLRLRTVPAAAVFRQHLRTVREAARAQGKQVRLLVSGENVELDTALADGIRGPLMHMVRNAVVHGIETPQERRAAGKSSVGVVELRAWHEPGRVMVQLCDDGRGLSAEHILARARELGLLAPEEQLQPAVLARLIFEPGFSTASATTELAGRGVGLDVVRSNVEALRGEIFVDSKAGVGTTFTLSLPLTLTIIEGFSVVIGGQVYVLPIEAVIECIDLPSDERYRDRQAGVLTVRGEPLPFVRVHERLRVGQDRVGRQSVVVLRHGSFRAGLVVDRVLGAAQAVIKPLPAVLRSMRGVSGSTVLGDGHVALILDVVDLLDHESRRFLDRGDVRGRAVFRAGEEWT